jgi:glycosyltransferase involved in cell wall biosynthesis
MNHKINIALSSFDLDLCSETFIKAHRELLNGNIFSYYGAFLPSKLAPGGPLPLGNRMLRALRRIYGKYCLKRDLYDYQIALRKSLVANKIDVFFAEYGQTAAWSLDVCRDLNLPLIVHFHGADAYRKDILDDYLPRYKQVFEYASAIVCVSKHMTKQLEKLGAPPDKITCNPCAPNDAFLALKNPAKDPSLAVAIGRFVDKKAPAQTLKAFANVCKKHPSARLIMAGTGPLLADCRFMLQELGLLGKVNFVGAISHDEVKQLFSRASIFVQHSVTTNDGDSEGTPVSILEASASGLPVIATRHGGIPDVIIDGETGLLSDENDLETMSENLLKMFTEPETAIAMGRAGRLFVRGNFAMDKHINILNDLIQKAVNHDD